MRLLSKKKVETHAATIRAISGIFIDLIVRLGRNVARPLGIAKAFLQAAFALHHTLPLFRGAHLFRLGEFGRGLVELLFLPFHGCRVS